jgi:L-fuconolactonase
MSRIDSHQHFWKFDPIRDSWIDETMSVIQRDFLPGDLQPLLHKHAMDGCVVVQTDQSEMENGFLLGNANDYDFIKGVVGWVDLQSPQVDKRLEYYSQFKKLKGFRHVLQGEADRALMLKPAFMNGIAALSKYGFTYDILIYPDQLPYVYDFVKAFPNQKFVIDHIAKPYIKDKKIDDWAKDIKALAGFENLYCKVSGMVTEANWKTWQQEDFTPYLNVVFETFGTKRLMYGSDWPVCNVAGGYDKAIGIVKKYIAKLSASEQDDFWGNTVAAFYKL